MTYTEAVHTAFDMSEPGERLKLALDEAGVTMPEASERWGWSYNTLKSNVNGNMPFSYKKALVYSGRLKVRPEWLLSGTLPMRPPMKGEPIASIQVPVFGWVQAGQLADVNALQEAAELETITADGLGAGDWFATDVKGDSMDRISPEGSRIFVNAADRTLVNGRFYLFSLRGETTYKRYYDEPVKRLEPYSWNPANRPIYPAKDTDWLVVGRVHRSVIDLAQI